MRSSPVNTRDRRAITIGAALLAPSLLFVYGVQPYRRTLEATRAETEHQRALLQRDRLLVARLPDIPTATTTVSQQLDRETGRLFNAENDLAATGDMAEYVSSAAKSAGVQLQHAETRPSLQGVPGVRVLQLDVHAEGDLDGILHFLHQLEAGDKLLRIDPLTVERAQGEGEAGKPDTVEVLSLTATIYGYRLTGELAPPTDSSTDALGAPSPFSRVPYDLPTTDAVIDHDPFAPTRARSAQSYRVVMMESPGSAKHPPSKEPPCTLMGTVIPVRGSGFAMCQTAGGVPKAVHVGGTIAGYTLSALRRGRAVFAAPDGRQVELHTSQPGSQQ
ncbi:MAG TPA: type II secretion system protein GspM [Gemmatimonadaceae bacterium]|nr:type II secretion system protein GspM [Gemmatimonadaceae bacterium]